MLTKQQLNEYRYIRANADRLEDELKRIDSELTRTTPVLSDMPKGSDVNIDKIPNLIAKKEARKEKINELLCEAYDKLDAIEDAIRYLPEREKLIMRLRYIEGMRWNVVLRQIQLCEHDETKPLSWGHLHRLHGESLKTINEK